MVNVINQFQNGVSSTANTLMTQLMCAEKGIDYNQLMHTAQQSHLQGILQQEQMRQMNQLVKRHYGGNTFVGKLKEAFSPDSSATLFSNPLTASLPGMPMSGLPAPQGGVDPMTLATLLANRVPNQQPVIHEQPAPQQVVPSGADQDRINSLESDIVDLKQMVMSIANALAPQQPQQPEQPQYQHQGYYPPEA